MRTCWLAVCIVFLWCCAVINPTTQQATPALRATISQSGIAELLNIATGLMVQKLSKLSIPNQSGDISTPIGHITYDVSNILLESISVGASNAVTSPPSTIQVSISEISVALSLNWGYRRDSWPHISDSGSAAVSTSKTVIQVGVVLGMENGRPTVSLSSCVVNLNDLSLTLHGGASWLYDIFKSIIESKIKSAISSAIEGELQSLTKNELAQILASLPTTVALDPKNAFLADLGIEVDLVANPTVGVQYFSLPLKGQFIDMNNNNTVPPFAQVAMPDVAPDAMIQLSVSQYMLDTLAFALYQSGKLHVTVVPSEIPSFFPLKLNTGALKMYLPTLYSAYPNQDLNLEVSVSAPVNFNIDTQGIHAVANATIGFMVMGNETVHAFDLGLGLELDVQIVVTQNNTIIPTFGISSFVVSLVNSNIGQFDVSTFGNILNVLITKLALPAVNKIIAQKAITIPIFDGVRLANADIVFNTGFLVIRSDLLFTAPQALYQYSRIRDTASYMQSPVFKQRQ